MLFAIDNLTDRTKQLSRQFEAVKKTLKISNETKEYIERVQSTYNSAKPKYFLDNERKSKTLVSKQLLKSYIPLHLKFGQTSDGFLAVNKHNDTTMKWSL